MKAQIVDADAGSLLQMEKDSGNEIAQKFGDLVAEL